MNKTMKAMGLFALLLCAVFGAVVSAHASLDYFNVSLTDVKVGGNDLNANQALTTQVDRNSQLQVAVTLQTDNSTSENNVVVTAFLTGAQDQISDSTQAFDVQPNTIYNEDLTLNVPQRTQSGDYQLRVDVASPNSATESFYYPLIIAPLSHSVQIKDVILSPNDQVIAGRSLVATVRVKNYGQNNENDVKVVVSMPDFGVQETSYIDQIQPDFSQSSDEMLLRIPANAQTGTYNVDTTVYYNDGDSQTTSTNTINVVANPQAVQAVTGTTTSTTASTTPTTIAVGPQTQTTEQGVNGAVYQLTITNGQSTSQTYTLTPTGTDGWATAKLSPSNVIVVNPGQSMQAYVYVAANEQATVGQHVFDLSVSTADGTVVQQIPFTTDVIASSSNTAWNGVKNVLEVGVVILVILIVILGLVVLYQRRTKGTTATKVEDEQIAQTYY